MISLDEVTFQAVQAGGYLSVENGYRPGVTIEYVSSLSPSHRGSEIIVLQSGSFAGKKLLLLPIVSETKPKKSPSLR